MRPTFLLALIAAILLLPGCSDERIFDPDRQQSEDPEEIETRKEVAALASGAKTDDPEHSAAYDKAINSLILRGSTVETRLIDLLDILYEIFPNVPKHVHAEPRAGDIYRSIGSPSKAMNILEFRPQVTLAEGVKEAVEEMRG